MVYFFRSPRGFIKIGFTRRNNPLLRAAEVGARYGIAIEILAVIKTGAGALERELHKKFAHLSVGEEWFKPDKELLEYVEGCKGARFWEPNYTGAGMMSPRERWTLKEFLRGRH